MLISSILLSLKTATIATLITFFLGILAAKWMMSYQGKGKVIIESILTAPLVLPPTVIGFLLLFLLGQNGFVGSRLAALNIRIVFTWYGIVIAAVVVSFPLMYKTTSAAFRQVDSNLLACARTLGASEWTIFWRILLPLAKPGLIAATLLSFARALGEFGATIMVAGAIPGKTATMPIAIYLGNERGELNLAFSLVLVMLTVSLLLLWGVENWQKPQQSTNRSRKTSKYRSYRTQQISSKISGKLTINISKQLTDFKLEVNLTCDHNPLALLGASGAGKTTIIRCIAGLETPDKGRIVLNNRVLFDSQAQINLPIQERNCGLLWQDYALFPQLTVAENVAFGINRELNRKQIEQIVHEQLRQVQLLHLKDRYPQKLSGGQKQRVALARLRASNPEILLLDEPFSALDTYLRHQQEKLLKKSLQSYQGVTLLITHNLEEAYRLCSRLLVIDEGKAIAHDTKENIFYHAPNIRTAEVTNCKNFAQGKVLDSERVRAKNWHCDLELTNFNSPQLTPVSAEIVLGIRAHQIILEATIPEGTVNTFNCWLAGFSETQHRVTCYLKLHQSSHHPEDYHLQAEILKDKWHSLQQHPLPWQIQLKPDRIMIFPAHA